MALRPVLTTLHRWFGLAAALFLFLAGATGALIAWDHEIDAWLNPQLFRTTSDGLAQKPLDLAAAVEAADPRVQVTYLPLAVEPDHALTLRVAPRVDPATGQPYVLDHDQVMVDPVTGQVLGRRLWGVFSLSRENLMPFLYKLHYTLHLPAAGGIELGVWLMGLIGIAWVFDSLIALWISFPRWSQWRRSFAFRWRDGGHRLVFDLHRSGGVWIWLLVLMLAVTSVSMNLNREVMRPLVGLLSPLSTSPFDKPPLAAQVDKPVPRAVVVEQAVQEARRRGLAQPVGGIFLSPPFGIYGVGFFEPGGEHGDGGLGNTWLYFDARTGRPAGEHVPGEGSAGDVFLQAMFPLHSGRILGVPGRVLMTLTGLAIAALSVTGVMIWARKRRARVASTLLRAA